MTRPARLSLAATVLSVALAGVACGGDQDDPPEVASLPTRTADGADRPVQSESADEPAGRPVLRLDDSDQRRFALWNAHAKCLLEHGASEATDGPAAAPQGARPGNLGILVEQPVPRAARAACVQLEPVGPLELEAATNPEFHEQSLAYVDCLREHGEYVRLLNDHNIDWTYVEGHAVPDDQAEFEEQCLLDAFGGR